MDRFPILAIVLAIAAIALPMDAQTANGISASPQKQKAVPQVLPSVPFSNGGGTTAIAQAIEFRSMEQMTREDRDLAADAEASIGERAGFAGLEFNEGKWSYRQLVCAALPNHLFLRFTRNNGASDVSEFSASIPRGEGRVRIIPIERRGYSLFSPAPVNAATIAAFNRIRDEEHFDKAPGWLGTGLCYAALTGAQPQIVLLAEAHGNFLASPSAILEVPTRGGAVIHFTDSSAAPRPMEWAMTFDGKGRLLKARHSPVAGIAVRQVQPSSANEQGKPVPATAVDLKGKPVE
jgi:hypothetical protein